MRDGTQPRLTVWPPLPPTVYLRRPRADLPFPLADRRSTLFSLGRHALWQGVRGLELSAGDEVLVPAYHHGSEIEALVRAGLSCRFYGSGLSLDPDESELDALRTRRTRALLLVHYLGFPADAARWRAWCDGHGLFLLEDAAQAWLATRDGAPTGSHGHVAVFCLYKTFGVPDGGALVVTAEPARGAAARRRGWTGAAARHVAWARSRSRWLSRLAADDADEYVAESDFALGEPATPPSAATVFLLPRLADPAAAARRRRNYRALLERLRHAVPPPFDRVPQGAAPFLFPVATAAKQDLLARLRRSGVFAFDFWSVGHPALEVSVFPDAARRRRTTVGLPVHQELRECDLERMVELVQDAPETAARSATP